MLPFKVIESATQQVPVLISVPHCGTEFPDELKLQYKANMIAVPDDTDWFVNKLYDFAPSLGITMITAVYGRWVIDLNRDPESKPLYTDGRIITGLCPTTDFLGNNIYNDSRNEVTKADIDERLQKYYWPYHRKLNELLQDIKSKFGTVLLWDCHSIRQIVPSIFKDKFPDLILGSDDEKSAGKKMIEAALQNLKSAGYSVNHNFPFKGGYITRHYGRPSENQHALQLEMTKVNYMDDAELKYDAGRADSIRDLLKRTLGDLASTLIHHR
jgi:N-formylglutamate deformylase